MQSCTGRKVIHHVKFFRFFFPAIFEGPRLVEIRILLPGQRDVTSSPLYSSHRISGTATFHAPVLRRQPTFRGDATTGFPTKLCPRNESRNSILMISEYPGLDSACDWLKISSTNQKHYPDRGCDASSISGADYGPEISALVSQTSFHGKLVMASRNVGCFLRLICSSPPSLINASVNSTCAQAPPGLTPGN